MNTWSRAHREMKRYVCSFSPLLPLFSLFLSLWTALPSHSVQLRTVQGKDTQLQASLPFLSDCVYDVHVCVFGT